MALSKRLFALYQMINKGDVVADIGCDHGLLAISLVKEGICPKVYACDLRKGPLSRAQEAVKNAKLEQSITTLLRNGMDDLPSDVDTIVIAGMGFDTIRTILQKHIDELGKYKKFIIQSNKHVYDLRNWINEHNFTIIKEDVVKEDHFYEIVTFTCDSGPHYSQEQLLFGVFLDQHPLFHEYWFHRLEKTKLALSRMPMNHHNRKEMELMESRIEHKLEER